MTYVIKDNGATLIPSITKENLTTALWREEFWDSTSLPPTLREGKYVAFVANNNSATLINDPTSRTQAIYASASWQFTRAWAIKEGVGRPTILYRSLEAIEGLPGESMRNYVFVERSPDGTMFYKGEIYKTLNMNNLISKFVGEPGEVVTHTWGGQRQRARDGKTYVYLASGVQDPDYPGGYGTYLPDTTRSVTLRADRSINVNFYYIAAELPEYNYLMRVSVPNGGFHIAILKEDVSDIKLKMPDGNICTVDIVTLEDKMASDIRVSLPTGIFALKKVVLSG